MVAAGYSNQQQGSKSRQNPCQVQPTENIGNLSASRRCLWVRTTVSTVVSGVLPVFKLQRRLFDVIQNVSTSRRVTRRQVMRQFADNGTDQCQNGSLNLLIPYREQPRSTRIIVAYPRPAFSATKLTNHAPISFDRKPKFLKATNHAEKRKIEIPRSMVVETLSR